MEKAYIYETKLGKIFIAQDEVGITEVSIVPESEAQSEGRLSRRSQGVELQETELLRTAIRQLTEYLEGTRKVFDIPLNPKGTQFQQRVWGALKAIPYGETRSYKQIAQAVGNEKASRAIGMANHNNPIMCIIPCHRVIGANGALVGYAGGLKTKEHLLNLERTKA